MFGAMEKQHLPSSQSCGMKYQFMKYPLILLIFITGIMLSTGTAVSATSSRHWTPDDIVNQESASQFVLSPDGKSVAWVKSRNSTEKDRKVTDLYLTRLDRSQSGSSRSSGRNPARNQSRSPGSNQSSSAESDHDAFLTIRLTRSEESDRNPFFSKDGGILYFLSTRDEGKKLWALNLNGGEPYEVHTFDEGIRNIQQLDDGRIVFVSQEGDLLIESQRKERKDNTLVIEDTLTFKPSRLFVFDPEKKEVLRLTRNRHPISDYAVSPDGRWGVTSHIRSPHYGADAQPPPVVYFHDLSNGKKIRILKGMQTPGSFQFTRQNDGFYFTAVTSSDPEWSGAGISELYYVALPDNLSLEDEIRKQYGNGSPSSLQPVKVPLEHDWGVGGTFHVAGNDVLVPLANGPLLELAYFERRGSTDWRKFIVETGQYEGRVIISDLSRSGDRAVFVYSTASTPPRYLIGDLETRRRSVRLTESTELFRLNTGLASKHIARTEIFRWTGAEDTGVNGILYYPENYEPGRRYPLVVAIRGGPAAVTLDRWNMSWAYFPHLLSQKGSFVLMPNYHGSSNHGLEFVESIKGRYYELELIDIVNGIETLFEAGKIDKDSLGVMGWSNGSILSIALSIEYPDLFRAVGAGAGTINWISDYGTCQFGVRFDQSYIGGAPWDSTDGTFYNRAYIEKSPLFRMDLVKTPTIIFFGSEDRAVPRDQGWEHYRAMQQIGKAPVRFLWFPGQPHSLQKLTHQRRKLTEEIAWFDRYLFGTLEEPNRAFKPGSPLADLLKRDSLARVEGYYGVRNSDTLIPEVVPLGKDTISIGRFTVTNQQYHAFVSEHTFHPLQANHPVTGISLEQARAYAKWLSGLTGNTWRLPNEDEAEALHRLAHRAGPRQNTLNHLAGYSIIPDEVPLLRQKVDRLGPADLIRAVGSFAPVKVGQAEIYDLGGNVAEWFDSDDKPTIGNSPSAGNNSEIGYWQMTGNETAAENSSVAAKGSPGLVTTRRSIYGYGAVHFVDPADPSRPMPYPEFTGFRMIRE